MSGTSAYGAPMDITPEMITAFRSRLNLAFADTTKWPDAVIEEALHYANTETGSSRWGMLVYTDPENLKWRGMCLFAAHVLATDYGTAGVTRAQSSEARLNVQSKSVGDESIAYRVPVMMDVANDWLTYTNYGQQFYRLRRRVGMGAKAV